MAGIEHIVYLPHILASKTVTNPISILAGRVPHFPPPVFNPTHRTTRFFNMTRLPLQLTTDSRTKLHL